MKILIIISAPVLAGAQRVTFNLSDWISKNTRDTVSIIALAGTSKNTFDTSKYDFKELPPGNKIKRLREAVKACKPDVVLTMGVPLCVFSVPALFGIKAKHIISERNDPAHFAGKKITKYLSRFLMQFADAYVFQTSQAQNFYGGRILKKSIIIHNPVFEHIGEDRVKLEERRKEIVSVGRLNKQKNQILLINAFAEICQQYPEYTLVIWGEGNERNMLEERINELNLNDSIFLPGSTRDLFFKIRDSYFFVLPSNFEGMPNALMEAMSLGLACISTDCPCGGPKELIKTDLNGILIPVGDQESLKNAMIKLLDNPELIEKIGDSAMKINKSHSLSVICKQWYNFFNDVYKM